MHGPNVQVVLPVRSACSEGWFACMVVYMLITWSCCIQVWHSINTIQTGASIQVWHSINNCAVSWLLPYAWGEWVVGSTVSSNTVAGHGQVSVCCPAWCCAQYTNGVSAVGWVMGCPKALAMILGMMFAVPAALCLCVSCLVGLLFCTHWP